MSTYQNRSGMGCRAAVATALISVVLAQSAHAANKPGFSRGMSNGGGNTARFQGGMQSQPSFQPMQLKPSMQQQFIQPKPSSQSMFSKPSRRPSSSFPNMQTLPGKPVIPGRVVNTFPTNPGTTKPQIINPQIIKPGGFQPGTIRPGTVKPEIKNPIVNQPGFPKPIGTNPIVTKPGFPKPIVTNPIVTKPVFPKPIGSNPIVTKPGSLNPGVKSPILTKPGKIADAFPKPIAIDPAKLKPGMKTPDLANVGNVKPRPGLADKLGNGKLADVLGSKNAQTMDLVKQFDLKKRGDVARQLGLFDNLKKHGGWHDRMFCGPIAPGFKHNHFGCWYPGPGCYPSYCWAPCWNPWVQWCWWDYCYPVCDPRPICYDPCGPWVHWHYPIWRPLPIVVCGTWIDVPVVHVPVGLDLQLLAVRFVDPGHPEQQLGPRYRVWFRNNSPVDIHHPFDVMLLASNDDVPSATLPQAGVRVTSMAAGAIQAIDIRLPFEANVMNKDAAGRAIPFDKLHVLVDARREIVEAFEENNGQIMARVDVFPVDPAVFAADVDAAAAGSAISVAGEGLGPEPGRVLVFVGGMELEAVLEGWYDLGLRFQIPGLQVAAPTAAEIVVVRGDGAAADPLSFTLLPQAANVVAAPLPAP